MEDFSEKIVTRKAKVNWHMIFFKVKIIKILKLKKIEEV